MTTAEGPDADRDSAERRADDDRVEEVPAGGAGADSGAADAVEIDPDDEASPPEPSPLNDVPGVGPRED